MMTHLRATNGTRSICRRALAFYVLYRSCDTTGCGRRSRCGYIPRTTHGETGPTILLVDDGGVYAVNLFRFVCGRLSLIVAAHPVAVYVTVVHRVRLGAEVVFSFIVILIHCCHSFAVLQRRRGKSTLKQRSILKQQREPRNLNPAFFLSKNDLTNKYSGD